MAKTTIKINPKDLADDVKAGMDYPALMNKYQIPESRILDQLLAKLVSAGLAQSEDMPRNPIAELKTALNCPFCGAPQKEGDTKCGTCGRIFGHKNIVKKDSEAHTFSIEQERGVFLSILSLLSPTAWALVVVALILVVGTSIGLIRGKRAEERAKQVAKLEELYAPGKVSLEEVVGFLSRGLSVTELVSSQPYLIMALEKVQDVAKEFERRGVKEEIAVIKLQETRLVIAEIDALIKHIKALGGDENNPIPSDTEGLMRYAKVFASGDNVVVTIRNRPEEEKFLSNYFSILRKHCVHTLDLMDKSIQKVRSR